MTDNKNQKKYEILNQFIKDLSFEAPNSPKVFFEKMEEKPNVEVSFQINSTVSGENLFEVNIKLNVKNSLKDRVLYLIELSYSAMVGINPEASKEEKGEILIKKVPSFVFPFVRSLIADITKESGFMPFILAPIDFDTVEAKEIPNTTN